MKHIKAKIENKTKQCKANAFSYVQKSKECAMATCRRE